MRYLGRVAEPLKIALVILHADPARGGAERYTVDLASALASRGHDLSLLASSFAAVPPGVTAVRLESSGITRVGRYQRFLKSLDHQTPPGRFDLIHAMLPVPRCDFYHPHAGIAAEAAGGLAGAGRSILQRLNRRRVKFAAVEKKLLEGDRPPVVLTLSDVIGGVLEKWYPDLPVGRRVKLFNGVDTEKFRPAADRQERTNLRARFGLPADVFLALMIAQDFDRKGLMPTIQALATGDSRTHLVVAGRDDPARFKRAALLLNVLERIHWLGPTDDPASLYRTADVFVLPTRHDPCSLVVLEALATGVPVITTAKNGAAEIMDDHVHGVILKGTEPAEIARALALIADESIRLAMGENCRKLRGILSWESHVEGLVSAYETARVFAASVAGAEPGYLT